MPDLTVEQRVGILNKFITEVGLFFLNKRSDNIPHFLIIYFFYIVSYVKGLIDIYKQPGGKIIYKIKTTTNVESLRGADNEEKVVYRIVEEAGNKGIWIRDIRIKSNLMPTQLNKIMKNLESKKIIKSVKTVTVILGRIFSSIFLILFIYLLAKQLLQAGKKKVFMLYNLEPDRSLTGGAWYSDQDFESEFVDVLNQQCYRFLEMKKNKSLEMIGGPLVVNNNSYASVADVWKFINELGISKVSIS